MENLKIKVNNNVCELVELFKQYGCKYFNHTGSEKNYMFFEDGHTYFCKLKKNFNESKCKEVSIEQLRDLVVLKRNDPKDANCKIAHQKNMSIYKDSKGDFYFFSSSRSAWVHQGVAYPYGRGETFSFEEIKLIEKEMKTKEYLKKNTDGVYELVDGTYYIGQHSWIEVPEGADELLDFKTCSQFFRNNRLEFFNNTQEKWIAVGDAELNPIRTLWQRHTQPEDLPFVDNKPTPNDQHAEIEQVRQSAWDKQEGGNHYKNLAIQPMEYALKNKLDYAQANVVKYVTRHANKNGKEDLLKAIHNIELMIEHYYS